MDSCIFCKIIDRKIASDIVFESDNVVAFPDINPAADTHILIVPKQHVTNIGELKNEGHLLVEIYKTADKLVEDYNLKNDMYRILVNGGSAQRVGHVHFHLLGGKWSKKENI